MLDRPIARRDLIASTVAGFATALLAGQHSARAEDPYPTRDVRIIVPFSAGGGTDLVTRLFAQQLGEKYGKAFFVENRAGGGGGSVGSLAVARSNPDGYTLGAGTSSGIQAAAIDPTDYSPLRDLQPIARFGSGTLVVAVNPKLPVKTVAELIAYVKAHPGLTYGSSGVGSTNHITGAMLAKDANINLRHIPYRGEGAALADVMAGQVQMIFLSLSLAKSNVQAGNLRALAITAAQRSPELPDVPTMIEAGFNDFIIDAWYGLYAPKGTPKPIIDQLVGDINEIRAKPAVKTKLMNDLGFDTSGTDSPNQFRTFMEAELQRYTAVVEAAGLKRK
jgi:tripartite-type tricarboxylate transporter receptor subunit TctC